MKRITSRFELRMVLVNDKEVIYQDPLLVLKDVAILTPATLASLTEDAFYSSILEIHVKDKAQALEVLDLGNFEGSRDEKENSRWHIGFTAEDCHISFRYPTPEDPHHKLDVFFRRSDDYVKVVQNLAALGLSYAIPPQLQPLPNFELRQRRTITPITHPYGMQFGSSSQFTPEPARKKVRDLVANQLTLGLPPSERLESLPPRSASTTGQVSNGNRNSPRKLPPRITPSTLSAGYPYVGVRVKSNGRPHSSQSINHVLYRTGLSSQPGSQGSAGTVEGTAQETMATATSQEADPPISDHRIAEDPHAARRLRACRLRSGAKSITAPAVEPLGKLELPPTRHLPFVRKMPQPCEDEPIFDTISPYFLPQNNIRADAPERQESKAQHASTKGTSKTSRWPGGSCPRMTAESNSDRGKESELSGLVSGEAPSLLAIGNPSPIAKSGSWEPQESHPPFSNTMSRTQGSANMGMTDHCEVKDGRGAVEWTESSALSGTTNVQGCEALGTPTKPTPVSRARSEHPPRRENHAHNLLFYTPETFAKFELALRKSTDPPTEPNNEPHSHLKETLEEAIIRTEAHQYLIWKTRASWEEKSEECMAAMSLGKQALLEVARKLGAEWAAHVSRDIDIAARKTYDQMRNKPQ